MEQKMFLRSYCLIGMGDIEGFKEDLSYVTESNMNFVSGKEMIIVTFKTTFKMGELEDYLNMSERTYIVFEATPGFFSANLNNVEFQKALFGGIIDNSKNNTFTIEEGIKEFMTSIKEDLEYEELKYGEDERTNISAPSLDNILDKISEVGIKNLSPTEKKMLNNYSKEKK